MANIKVELGMAPIDGQPIIFAAPCNCDEVDGLRVFYPGGSRIFEFCDAHGNLLTGIGNLFAKGAYVKAVLDVENKYAYLQNADTNKYLEDRFAALGVEDSEHPGCYYRMFNGIKEWINPPMMDGVEYRLTKRYNGKPLYAMAKLFDALPNTSNETVALSVSESKIEDYLALDVFAISTAESTIGNQYKLPFYNSTGELCAFFRTMGDRSVWIATTTDLSKYRGRIVSEYTKV